MFLIRIIMSFSKTYNLKTKLMIKPGIIIIGIILTNLVLIFSHFYFLSAKTMPKIFLNGEWKLHNCCYDKNVPAIPDKLNNKNFSAIPAAILGNVEFALLAAGKYHGCSKRTSLERMFNPEYVFTWTMVGYIHEYQKGKAICLIENSIGEEKYTNNYLAGETPFKLEKYQRWYKNMNIKRVKI